MLQCILALQNLDLNTAIFILPRPNQYRVINLATAKHHATMTGVL
jgi:hypothetical protein